MFGVPLHGHEHPGIDDMVNWKIIGRIFDRMDLDGYSGMDKYGNGSWAPALRYHDGKFWMYVCTPNEGLFMSTATDPAGPWSPLYQVKNVSGWEDPVPIMGRRRASLHRTKPVGRRPHHHP